MHFKTIKWYYLFQNKTSYYHGLSNTPLVLSIFVWSFPGGLCVNGISFGFSSESCELESNDMSTRSEMLVLAAGLIERGSKVEGLFSVLLAVKISKASCRFPFVALSTLTFWLLSLKPNSERRVNCGTNFCDSEVGSFGVIDGEPFLKACLSYLSLMNLSMSLEFEGKGWRSGKGFNSRLTLRFPLELMH